MKGEWTETRFEIAVPILPELRHAKVHLLRMIIISMDRKTGYAIRPYGVVWALPWWSEIMS
tara:strand:+ start:165 stop:347 length:183 start_codon:yes stop_codon:yes gene_type:complete